MMDLAQDFDRALGVAMARGLRPGRWRGEIERRFIDARFAGDEAACRSILDEWQARIAAAEVEQQTASDAERRALRAAERGRTAARLAPREVVETIERGGWHRLSLRPDGAIMIAGGPPEDEVLRQALEQQAEAVRSLLRERDRRSMLIPALRSEV